MSYTRDDMIAIIDMYLTESERTDRERSFAKTKEETINGLKKLNNTGTALAAISAATGAILAGEYALAAKKINDEIKKVKDELAKEKAKEDPDKDKVKELQANLTKLKASRILVTGITGFIAAGAAQYIHKSAKGLKRNNDLNEMKKTAQAEQKVAATYDKNGEREL